MTYEVETFKKVDGTLKSISKSVTDDPEWAIETEVEMHGLGKLLAQSKGASGTMLFEHGRINYSKVKE